ncbi:hypothetical protein KSF_066460 [Reticulibacter mediterranei]|uniref:Uncharacterized protein n=2 Tax=Reticulibacter mediterranei TaxID=2778369 RepID=A0A8J3IQ64_9CHLR|nr:hypothetical protein KSF_066460 [Reticulibacter mediterranei]
MSTFVNREVELKLVDEAFSALLSKQRLLRNPIVDFYGTGGIGKTSLLRKVEQICQDKHIFSLWADASQSDSAFSSTIVEQVEKYGVQIVPQEETDNLLHQSIDATRALLQQGPVVLLLDALDTADSQCVGRIEALLKNFVNERQLFVVIASKSTISFQNERSVARKLTSVHLPPLDRSSCEAYLKSPGSQIPSELYGIIFEWTRGFPLAMQAMTEAINAGHDPRHTQDRQEILAVIKDQVINQNVLAKVEPEKRAHYYTSLRLFSVPRRFNLMIMQDLIERFAPELKRESNLAYFALPREIQQATEVLKWNVPRAGYSVDTPVRNIFLLELKLEQLDDYIAIHSFLAETNKRLATEVNGPDRIRYLREYLYHNAIRNNSLNMPSILQQVTEQITTESPEAFSQFYEEFMQDEELKEALGEHLTFSLALIHSHLASIYKQLAIKTTGTQRLHYWGEFLFHAIHDPQMTDLTSMLQETLTTLTQELSPEEVTKLFQKLAHNKQFEDSLGEQQVKNFRSFLRDNHLEG